MRVKKSFLNVIANSSILIIRAVLQLVVRIVFVLILGKTYLGIDSLFTNILLALSIADTGMTTAINYSLYKPLANKNYNKLSQIMTYFKRMYNIMGIVVFLLGLVIMLFLPFLVDVKIDNIYLIFILYLLTTVAPYFISYKDALLTADQNNYKVAFITGGTYILMYVFRIIFLLLIPSFTLFVIIQLVMIIIQRVLINRYITKRYPLVNFNYKDKLEKSEKKQINTNVRAKFLQISGNYLITGTDSIIISANPSLGVALVGVYVNYTSVTTMIESIIYRGLTGITASYGDLAINEGKKTQENVFNIIAFLSFFLFGLFAVGFYFLLTPFIEICFGNDFVLSPLVVTVISITFYLMGNLKTLDVVKEATGTFVVDRYASVIQAGVNLIFSIILTYYYGIIGVVLGTLISTILVPLWNKPYIAYKYMFNKTPFKYFITQTKYLISLLLIVFVIYFVLKYIIISNFILAFFVKAFVILFMFILLISVLYWKNENYRYLFNLASKFIKRK